MNRLQKMWKDPVGSKLIAAGIIGISSPIFIYLWSLIKQISFKDSLFSILTLLNQSISVSLWIILVLAIALFFIFRYLLKSRIPCANIKADSESIIAEKSMITQRKPLIMMKVKKMRTRKKTNWL